MYLESKVSHVQENSNHLFVGLDVHKINWSVCIRTREFEHHKFSQPADVAVLDNYLKKRFPEYSVTIAYEAGCFGFSISRLFKERGYNCLVINAADIPGTDKEDKHKNDRSDCRKIARELSNGSLKGIYEPSTSQESFRCMFRQRQSLCSDFRKTKTRIRSFLLCYGIACPQEFERNNWTKAFRVWLGKLALSDPSLRMALDSLLVRYDFFRKEILSIELKLRKYGKTYQDKTFKILKSIPGIGPIVSLAFIAEIGDVNRFNRIDNLCSYIGLVPNIYQSGDTIKVKGITKRSHKILRSYLVESAWTAVRRDPELIEYYKKHTGKMLPNKIIIKVARKLLVRIYYCLKTDCIYELNHNHSSKKVIV